jgi:DNA-binding beta-propeller fold protein YncE
MRKEFARILGGLLAVALLGGCAAREQGLPRIFWPPPPDQPRMEWIGVYASQDDFPKTPGEKRAEALLGKPPLAVFKSPYGIVADGRGTVYVSDMHDRNLRVYDFNNRTVNYFSKEPIFDSPRGLALDGEGNLYVVDLKAHKVFVFAPGKTPLRVFGAEILKAPLFIALNQRLGRVYVSDPGRHKIAVFDLQGNHLFDIGEVGEKPGQFYSPQGLAIDREDRLFVADTLNARIQVLDADGNFIRMFGERGDQPHQFESPKDLAFDSEGNLWVADNRRPSIYTYTPDGAFLLVTGGAERSTHKMAFSNPVAIFIDANDRLYVTDLLNKRFSVWQYLSKAFLERHPISPEELRRTQEWLRLEQEKARKK